MKIKKHLILSLIFSLFLGLIALYMPTYALNALATLQLQEQELPILYMPDEIIGATGSTVTVPIELENNDALISAMLFSIDYNPECLVFDDNDEDGDRLLDGIRFYLPKDFALTVTHDITDASGEIDFIIGDLSPPNAVLYDGLMALITFEVICQPPAGETRLTEITFSTAPKPSFSSPDIRRVIAETANGAVRVYNQMPTGVPTATPITTPTMTLTPTPGPSPMATNTPTPTVSGLILTPEENAQPTATPKPALPSMLEFPIILQNGFDRITSANFTIEFNSAFLEFVEIDFNIPSTMQHSFLEKSTSIEVALYTPAASMPTLPDGQIAIVRLRLQPCQNQTIIADDLQITDATLGTIDGQSNSISKLTLSSSQLTNITCGSATTLTTTPSPEPLSTTISNPGSTATPPALPTVDPTIMIFSKEFNYVATSSLVQFDWRTTSEVGVTGFHIWRGPDADRRSAEQITEQLISGKGFSGGSYSFTLSDSDRENGYRYWLELITEDGTKRDIATLFVPSFRMTLFYLPIIQWSQKAIIQ